MEGRWNAVGFAQRCADAGVTMSSLVPAQVFDLVTQAVRAPAGLRAVVVGGGRLESGLGAAARALGWPVLQSYGMTETASQVATEPLEHLESGFDPDALEVLPVWQCSVVNDSLHLSGTALATGYVIHDGQQWTLQPLVQLWCAVSPNG
jgi:O-succinylbenzoic acid--CoA ligase